MGFGCIGAVVWRFWRAGAQGCVRALAALGSVGELTRQDGRQVRRWFRHADVDLLVGLSVVWGHVHPRAERVALRVLAVPHAFPAGRHRLRQI